MGTPSLYDGLWAGRNRENQEVACDRKPSVSNVLRNKLDQLKTYAVSLSAFRHLDGW